MSPIYIHAGLPTYILTCIYTYTDICIHIQTHVFSAYTYISTNLHLYIHIAYIHTHIYVTGSKFGLWKTQQGSCLAEENSQWGCWCRHRQILAIPLHMCSAFPTELGEQTILMSFSDIIIAPTHGLGERV